MSSIFEKTMQACLESNKKSAKANKKKVMKESVKKVNTKKRFTEDEDIDEVDVVDDVEIDDEIEDEVDPEISDDVVVVVDPEMTADDISEFADEAQDIIDETPDGEDPINDEYIDDFTYTCPICGNTFFSEEELGEGDECPVCGEFPDDFVLVGQIEPTEDIVDDEVVDDDEEAIDDEELDVDVPAEEDEADEELESLKRRKATAKRRVERKAAPKKAVRKVESFFLDEKTFNPVLTKFVRENYKNAKSFAVKSAKKSGNILTLECVLTFRSGKTKRVALESRGFRKNAKVLAFRDKSGAFKMESKGSQTAPFIFNVKVAGRVVKCESLRYNFVTKLKEGKRAQVYGKVLRESK